MPGPIDHIAYLSREVGPRPAGTEEEQQAALYITEQLQKEAGLSAVIEDFNTESNEELPRAICAGATLLLTVLALFLPVMAIPSLLVAVVAGLIYVMESLDRPIISKMFARGVSQNVVAKYEPGYSPESGSSRRRKIILVANYDSGKVRPELSSPLLGVLPILQKITLGAMAFIPVFLLIRYLFFLHAEGATAIILNVITIIALIFVALPVVAVAVHKFSPYNEAANCNGAGVSVLLEVASRVGRGRVSGDDFAARTNTLDPAIHGEEAARASGLIPEGAQLVYEASQMRAPEPAPQTEEERLFAAKAAIAAMTGRPVPNKENSSIADHLVQIKESPVSTPDEETVREIREETREAFSTVPAETLQYAQEKASAEAGVQDTATGEVMPSEAMAPNQNLTSEQGIEPAALISEQSQPQEQVSNEPAVPDWFKKAQENAKKPKNVKPAEVQRSRYASALDAAVAESSSYFQQANKAVSAETEERLRKMRDGIMEVSAPQVSRETVDAQRMGYAVDNRNDSMSQPAEAPQTFDTSYGRESFEQNATPTMSQGVPATDLGNTVGMPPINVDELRATPTLEQGNLPNTNNEVAFDTTTAEALSNETLPSIDSSGARHPIVLPDIGLSATNLAPIDTSKQQRAPLAVAEEESSQEAAKGLLNMLPSIDLGEENSEEEPSAVSEATRPNLKNTLPSLSGALSPTNISNDDEAKMSTATNISATGSFASLGATGTFSPVGDELLQDVDPDDIYVDDADDSVYEGSFTETGALAGPGYVDMPKSRVRRFFDRFSFGKDKDEEALSAKEWLDVDEDFDAREVGAARGGWESFQDEQADEDFFDENTASGNPAQGYYRRDNDDEWEGGAFSGRQADEVNAFADDSFDFGDPAAIGEAPLSASGEMQQIYQFRYPGLDTEIWFVALGSELANNGGIKAFLAEHEQDLRGSIVINLEGLGSGELCYLEKEGFRQKAGASSRMKRYVKKASQTSGVSIGAASIGWKESATTVSARKGVQAMTIVGMEGDRPAHFAQGDDVLENIDEETLQMNAEFVMELLRSI